MFKWFWTILSLGAPVFVALIRCGNPGKPDDATVVSQSKNYWAGEYVRYLCNPGYTMVGPVVRRCLPSGKWSGYVPTCKWIWCKNIRLGEKIEKRAYLISETYFIDLSPFDHTDVLVLWGNPRWDNLSCLDFIGLVSATKRKVRKRIISNDNRDFKVQQRNGDKNVALKVNLQSFSLYGDYSYPLTLSIGGEPS